MRILALTNLYPNPLQPVRATFNRRQFRALADRHELRVIAPISWTDELKARWRGAGPLPPGRQHLLDGIPVEHPRYYYPPKMLRSWHGHFYRWSVRDAFQRAVDEFHPDLIFTPWAYPDGWAALQLGRKFDIPVVVKLHGSDVLTLNDSAAKKPGTIEVMKHADGLVPVSKDLARAAIALGAAPERVRVVYCGLDHSVFNPGNRAAARERLGLSVGVKTALFVGNLVPVKGVDVLLEACALLAADTDFQCHVIGEGPLRSSLERQASQLGLNGHVRFLGTRANAELPDWYRSSNVFVLPSHSEGVPSVLLEATACGTPFVASRVGGIPEIAHYGVNTLVPPNDPRALAEGLREFLRPNTPQREPGVRFTRTCADAVADLSGFFEEILERPRLGRTLMSSSVPYSSHISCESGRAEDCVDSHA